MNANPHPNGFVVRLLANFRGYRLRLHTWPANPKRQRLETPHDHRSWFLSLPLWGWFSEWRFIQHDPGCCHSRVYNVLRCHSTSGNGAPITTPDGHAGLIPDSRHIRRPLIPYFCPEEAIHSFVPLDQGFAASLVLFGPPRRIPRAFVAPEGS